MVAIHPVKDLLRQRLVLHGQVKADPRTEPMRALVLAEMKRLGWTQSELSRRSLVDQSHLSKWFAKTAGLSIESFMDVLQALAVHWAILPNDADNPREISVAGTIDRHGIVHLLGGPPTMPALFLVDEAVGDIKPGDRVLIVKGGFSPGDRVLVRHPDGMHRLHRCEVRNGLQLLVSSEAVLYDEGVHEIVGIAEDVLKSLRGT